MKQRVNTIAAEQRAVEEGHHARLNDDGSLSVKSDSRPDTTYRITFHIGSHFVSGEAAIWFRCTCPSGENRPDDLVPCKHSTLAGRRLERESLAFWHSGIWFATPKARQASLKAEPDIDPLEGLPSA